MRVPQPGVGRQNSHQRLVGACTPGTPFIALVDSLVQCTHAQHLMPCFAEICWLDFTRQPRSEGVLIRNVSRLLKAHALH